MMGLQLDAGTRGKIVTFLKVHGLKLSIASYLAGITWMALLVHHEFSAKNYFSENQLLPGLVDTRFSEYRYTTQIYGNIRTSCDSNDRTLQQKVREELENMNLDVYQQSFYVPTMMLNGTNIYGFYRVPRASGVESIVLNVPLRRNCSSVGAISLMLGLAKHISKQSYWAKDIVFVLTEHDLYGMKAWLSSYFHEESKDVIGDNLYGHGGSIQAAIIFDFPTEHVTHFDLLIEGLNGQLPNLDVINLVFQIGRFESVPVKFAHQNQFNQPNHDFLANFQTLLRMMINQASGVPTGNHGLFFKYRIEAVTLRGVIHSQRNWERIYFEQQGRFIEGILRSINNMLEHFHQSFFLYVLPNTHRYISIGMYMPPLACLLLPLLVKLFMLWADIFKLDAETTSETENVAKNVYIPLTTLFQLSTVKIVVIAAIITWMFIHIFTRYHVDLANIGNANIVIVHSVLLLTGLVMLLLLRPVDLRELQVLQLYAILHLALLIGITSILNFSLAYFIALFSTPLVFVKWNTNTRRFSALLKMIFFALINPASVIYLMCILSVVSLKELSFDYELSRKTLNLYKNIFSNLGFLSIVETMNVDIISANILPLWLVFGCL